MNLCNINHLMENKMRGQVGGQTTRRKKATLEVLKKYPDLAHKIVAERFGISVGTVKRWLAELTAKSKGKAPNVS